MRFPVKRGFYTSVSLFRFREYLLKTRNTICGRHVIGLMLHALQLSTPSFQCHWLHYSQSSRVTTARDSSVSYASAAIHEA